MYMNSLGNNLREIWINLLREVAPFIEKGQSKEALMIKDQEVSRRVAKMSEMMHMSKQAHWKCSPETLKAVCIERVDYDHKKALISWTGSGATATCPFIPNAGTVLTASWVPLKELYHDSNYFLLFSKKQSGRAISYYCRFTYHCTSFR